MEPEIPPDNKGSHYRQDNQLNPVPTHLTFFVIAIVAAVAASSGILIKGGPGGYDYMTIRGKTVHIYGKGLYKDMSSDVAVQGIAQDYVTLFIAIPLLITAWYFSRKNSLKWRFILTGILNYFLVTYMIYLRLAMYNVMFPAYIILAGTSFFALAVSLLSFETSTLPMQLGKSTPVKLTGGFLIFNSIIISLLWLSVILPPILDGTIIPDAVQHYTTLTVQGPDLAKSPLESFLLPGLFLLFINGFANLVAVIHSFSRNRHAGHAGLFLGIVLTLWIIIQVW